MSGASGGLKLRILSNNYNEGVSKYGGIVCKLILAKQAQRHLTASKWPDCSLCVTRVCGSFVASQGWSV